MRHGRGIYPSRKAAVNWKIFKGLGIRLECSKWQHGARNRPSSSFPPFRRSLIVSSRTPPNSRPSYLIEFQFQVKTTAHPRCLCGSVAVCHSSALASLACLLVMARVYCVPLAMTKPTYFLFSSSAVGQTGRAAGYFVEQLRCRPPRARQPGFLAARQTESG